MDILPRRKVKVYTFLTSVERAEAQAIALARQTTLSEWIRLAIIEAINNAKDTPLQSVPTALNAHPQAPELLKDFIIGDINESTDETGDL